MSKDNRRFRYKQYDDRLITHSSTVFTQRCTIKLTNVKISNVELTNYNDRFCYFTLKLSEEFHYKIAFYLFEQLGVSNIVFEIALRTLEIKFKLIFISKDKKINRHTMAIDDSATNFILLRDLNIGAIHSGYFSVLLSGCRIIYREDNVSTIFYEFVSIY